MADIVDLTNFYSFCFRGEGCSNFVISAKSRQTGIRIVWRLSKDGKTGNISMKPKCHVINAYLENLISHFLDDNFLIKPKIVVFKMDDVHHLAKMPSLTHNLKLLQFEMLKDLKAYPSSLSFFPIQTILLNKEIKYISALEMEDCTRIPKRIPNMYGPTITFEIKPKQGFYQTHPGIVLPFCNNCILQIEKWNSKSFDRMYDFCPLDLYSDDLNRMRYALLALIREPHKNLRMFIDGNLIHSEESRMPSIGMSMACFPDGKCDIDTLVIGLCNVLSSVLPSLLNAQKLDNIGIIQALNIYNSLDLDVKEELMDKKNLLHRGIAILNNNDPRSLLERYLLAGIFKDVSVMVSMRLVNQTSLATTSPAQNIVSLIVPATNKTVIFAYSVRVVDLDPKTPKNLINCFERFQNGVRLIQANPNIHKPCHI